MMRATAPVMPSATRIALTADFVSSAASSENAANIALDCGEDMATPFDGTRMMRAGSGYC